MPACRLEGINNFKHAHIKIKLEELDSLFRFFIGSWLCNRLRYCIWSRYLSGEKVGTERKNLIRLGVEAGIAYAWSRSRMGGWAIAQSPILGTTITIDRLKKRGYVPLAEMYNLMVLKLSTSNSLFPMV